MAPEVERLREEVSNLRRELRDIAERLAPRARPITPDEPARAAFAEPAAEAAPAGKDPSPPPPPAASPPPPEEKVEPEETEDDRVAAAVKAAEEAVAFVAQALEQAETDDMIAEELGDDPESEKARAAARKAREVAATVQAELDRHHANVLRMKHAA